MEFAQMEIKLILSTLLQNSEWRVKLTTAEIAPVRQPMKVQNTYKQS
jgi:cytochrome P450